MTHHESRPNKVDQPTPIGEGSIKVCKTPLSGLVINEFSGQVYLFPGLEQFEFLAVSPSVNGSENWQVYHLGSTHNFIEGKTLEAAFDSMARFSSSDRVDWLHQQTELHSQGRSDALSGNEPAHADKYAYRSGWNLAVTEAELTDRPILDLPEESKRRLSGNPLQFTANSGSKTHT